MYNLCHLISNDKHHNNNRKKNTVSDRRTDIVSKVFKWENKLFSGTEKGTLEPVAIPGDRRLAAT